MSIGRTNASGGGTGATLTVTAPAGVTVTAVKDGKARYRTANAQGVAIFKGLATGTWAVTISDGEHNPTTQQVLITADYTMVIAFFAATIAVTYPVGSTCTCVKGSQVLTAPDTSGNCTFTVPEVGDWIISCTDGTQTASKTISITADGQSVAASLNYNTIPEFTYTGDYEIVDDADTPITTSDGNWKIRFLTSGVFTPTDLRGAADGIDVFLVGGGGGVGDDYTAGAGGGYTQTIFGVQVQANESYTIVVGAGGSPSGGGGGKTSAFGNTANGGDGVKYTIQNGGNGGNGGGGYGADKGGNGGSDGSDGSDGSNGTETQGTPGKGQGTSTREFGETNGTLYAGAGGGGSVQKTNVGKGGAGGGANGMTSARPNTGGGAGGGIDGSSSGRNGGSGIVIIRNTREVG